MKTCKSLRKLGILLLLLISVSNTIIVRGQESPTCAEKLQTAHALFGKGQVHQIPQLISDCLEKGFNREESLDAFKLIIQCYLFEEKLNQADSAMLSFRRKYPEYELSTTDHSSFVALFNNYVSRVVIQVSLHLGTNIPYVIVTESNPHFTDAQKKYSAATAINLFGSLEAKYKLSQRTELNAEIGYSQISFKSTESTVFASSVFSEKYSRLEIPLGITYDITRWKRFIPYVRVAGGPAITISAKATGTLDMKDKNNHNDRSGSQIDMSSSRIMMDLFLQAGGGIKFKIPRGFIFAEVRSNFGFTDQSVFKGYISPNDDPDWFYMHSDDRFRINALNFNWGYTMILYKPVRKEE